MRKLRKYPEEINVGSTADIAFLLLIFFLVATTLSIDKGLTIKLPPKPEEESSQKVKERNIFKIQINSKDELMVNEDVRSDLKGLMQEIQVFILNEQKSESLAESPSKAVVSLKTNRGTGYDRFIDVLDEIKGAYYGIYADRAGMTPAEFRSLDRDKGQNKSLYLAATDGIPMNISIAEPN